MDYLLDTNIVIHFVRNSKLSEKIEREYFQTKDLNLYISIVEIGELESIALKNKWGTTKKDEMFNFLSELTIININYKNIIHCYAEIDAYSQGKLENRPSKFSARNMGKNDLWIAATASVLNIPLMTTDTDFQHLDKEFLNVIYISTS